MIYDVLIVGAGPGGLSAALALGRARKRVLVCDGAPRRNARASHIYNFVTRDGTPPDEFRAIAREQIGRYRTVEVRDVQVDGITGERGAFRVMLGADSVTARRILLATGMIDDMLPIEGFAALWGHSIFQCPYCHGHEIRDRPWAFLARPEHAGHLLPFAVQLRSWTDDAMVFTNGAFHLPDDARERLSAAGIAIETAPIKRLVAHDGTLASIELADGRQVSRAALFVHPPQRQVPLVAMLGVALDEHGFVVVDLMSRETSVPGIYAGGDLTSRMQGALFAAGMGTQAAAMLNVDLSFELFATPPASPRALGGTSG